MTKDKKETFLKDYTKPVYLVDTVELRIELDPTATRVFSRLQCQVNGQARGPLVLNGEKLDLVEVRLNKLPLEKGEFSYDGDVLTIVNVPDEPFSLEVETIINPAENTALEGLYLSSGNYCTQCEAEGFRRITCFPDRPDVMAVFTTTVVGDQETCPVLLSNGNLVERGELKDGRHFATWHDPFKKPCYLFALVAGNLVCVADRYTTMSGRTVDLHFFVEPRNRDKCEHAMESLKKAMQWDEQEFGREYDLDIYMIVAVDDFNMGAMENKGLNVFNSKYVLALPETATDSDYAGIEGVVAHEYFHNWTGNRVTCRDWFQLSLKEGLTVFRDQEFSADMTSRSVKRIQDANIIRSFQFREDGGPLAHPVRPASFVEINNFYTLTVYNKGAEVIRMMQALVGKEGFRKGMDLYFDRHDGQAVTCDDFVAAIEDGGSIDLTLFKRWYSQAGTPEVLVEEEYDPIRGEYSISLSQSCPPTPDGGKKLPFYIPLAFGLLTNQGEQLEPSQQGQAVGDGIGQVLVLEEQKKRFVFNEIDEKPILSILRNFSAPIKIKLNQEDQDLGLLMAHDSDAFNRWDAGQKLGLKYLLEQVSRFREGGEVALNPNLALGMEKFLLDTTSDPAFLAMALTLPSENWISQQMETVDPVSVFSVRQQFRSLLSAQLAPLLLQQYQRLGTTGTYSYDAQEAGRRALRNCCLTYLLVPPVHGSLAEDLLALGRKQYFNSDNMTETIAALKGVVDGDNEMGTELLADFYHKWKHDPLVIDKWLMLQASCVLPHTLDRVKQLLSHEAFSYKNPNKVRALIATFCSVNHHQFHCEDGAGYLFLGDQVITLDRLNPQIASRLVTPLTHWRRYDSDRQGLMKKQLRRISSEKTLSGDVKEIVSRSLA